MRYSVLLFSLLVFVQPAYSQLAMDFSPYTPAILHYPIELSAKINTNEANYGFFQRVFSSHADDMKLIYTMDTNRETSLEPDELFEYTYHQQISKKIESNYQLNGNSTLFYLLYENLFIHLLVYYNRPW